MREVTDGDTKSKRPKRDPALGDRLRTIREQASLDQADVAEIVGVTRSAVTHFEGGKPPGRKTLSNYAKHFGVNLNWLMHGTGDQYLAVDAASMTDLEKQMLDAFRRLPEAEAAQWLHLLMTRLNITNN